MSSFPTPSVPPTSVAAASEVFIASSALLSFLLIGAVVTAFLYWPRDVVQWRCHGCLSLGPISHVVSIFILLFLTLVGLIAGLSFVTGDDLTENCTLRENLCALRGTDPARCAEEGRECIKSANNALYAAAAIPAILAVLGVLGVTVVQAYMMKANIKNAKEGAAEWEKKNL